MRSRFAMPANWLHSASRPRSSYPAPSPRDNHFAHAGTPGDAARAADYEASLPKRFAERLKDALAATVPEDADPAAVATAVVEIVNAALGKRPFRVVVDPASDGAVVSYTVIDRVREEFLHRIGFAYLLRPTYQRD